MQLTLRYREQLMKLKSKLQGRIKKIIEENVNKICYFLGVLLPLIS